MRKQSETKQDVRDRQHRHLVKQRSPNDLLNRAVRVQVDSGRRCVQRVSIAVIQGRAHKPTFVENEHFGLSQHRGLSNMHLSNHNTQVATHLPQQRPRETQ